MARARVQIKKPNPATLIRQNEAMQAQIEHLAGQAEFWQNEARQSIQVEFRNNPSRTGVSNYLLTSAMSTVYGKIKQHRSEIYKAVDETKHYFISHVLLEQIAEDALTPDVETGEVVEAHMMNNEPAEKEIIALNERIGFDRMFAEISEDFLAQGEYTLRTKVSAGRGLVDLFDDVDQEKVIAVTKYGQIEKYLTVGARGKVLVAPPQNYVKFMLGNARMRVNLIGDNMLTKLRPEERRVVPKYVRIGKSLIFPIISKIKELQLLELLVPATKISKLSSGTLIGVQVPASMNPQDALEAAKQIENLLNQKIGVDQGLGQLTIQNVISSAGRLKAVPVFGEKGTLQKFDYKPDEPDDMLATLRDVRSAILSSVGIPYEVIFGGDNLDNDKRGAIIRRNSRYLRRLKNIQRAFVGGLRQLIHIHLVQKGISFRPSDLKIEFKNKLIQADLLDELEYLDTTVSMLAHVTEFLLEDPNIEPAVNRAVYLEYIRRMLAVLGLTDVIDPTLMTSTTSKYLLQAAMQMAAAEAAAMTGNKTGGDVDMGGSGAPNSNVVSDQGAVKEAMNLLREALATIKERKAKAGLIAND